MSSTAFGFWIIGLIMPSLALLVCVPMWRFLQYQWAWVGTVLLSCITLVSWYFSLGDDNEVLAFVLTTCIPWLVPLLICGHIWPFLRQKRTYVVTTAVLCLTPCASFYFGKDSGPQIWPMILTMPQWMAHAFVSTLKVLAIFSLVPGILVGVISWLLCRKYLPPSDTGKNENE